jgi:hypothetical protein
VDPSRFGLAMQCELVLSKGRERRRRLR